MITDLIEYNNGDVRLIPENDDNGNIEYKLRLDLKDEIRLCKTNSQLQWRLNEGKKICGRHEAIYVFGILDDGDFPPDYEGITEDVLDETIDIFRKNIKKINCKIVKLHKYIFKKVKIIAVAKVSMDIERRHNITETNVVLAGLGTSGKTSLLSRLTYDQEDNGKGYSRKLLLKHKHEKAGGVTSDIHREFIGFSGNELMNYFTGMGAEVDDIYSMSDRYVTINDLPGDNKYLRSTLYGLLSSRKDVVAICISAEMFTKEGIIDETSRKFYADLCNVCIYGSSTPVILVMKTDLIDEDSIDDVLIGVRDLFKDLGIHDGHIVKDKSEIKFNMTNIIPVSNVDEDGCDTFIGFLCEYSKNVRVSNRSELIMGSDDMFVTNKVFKIMNGAIFYGYMRYGEISVGDTMNIVCGGKVISRKIKSIQKKMVESEIIRDGESGCIQFHNLDSRIVNKTSVVISDSLKRFLVDEVVFHPVTTDLPPKKNYLMFNGSTIQTVDLSIDDGRFTLRSTNKTKLFIHPGSLIVLKDETHYTYIGRS